MDDKKFENILDEWMSHEIQEVPELHPREEMYKRIKEKQRKTRWTLFPKPLRWTAVGAAAAVIILMIVFYPGQEGPAIGLRKGYVIGRGDPHKGPITEAKKGEKKGEKKGPMMFDALHFQYLKMGTSLIEEIDMQAPEEEKFFLSSKDNYRILFQLRQELYIYIYQLDSSNMLIRLFPYDELSPGKNPVQKGELFYLPAAPNWLFSKKRRGEEKIYVIASSSPKLAWDELYEQYSRLKKKKKKLEFVSRLLDEFAAVKKGLIESTEVQIFTFHNQ
jgi:hypothetical protein